MLHRYFVVIPGRDPCFHRPPGRGAKGNVRRSGRRTSDGKRKHAAVQWALQVEQSAVRLTVGGRASCSGCGASGRVRNSWRHRVLRGHSGEGREAQRLRSSQQRTREEKGCDPRSCPPSGVAMDKGCERPEKGHALRAEGVEKCCARVSVVVRRTTLAAGNSWDRNPFLRDQPASQARGRRRATQPTTSSRSS